MFVDVAVAVDCIECTHRFVPSDCLLLMQLEKLIRLQWPVLPWRHHSSPLSFSQQLSQESHRNWRCVAWHHHHRRRRRRRQRRASFGGVIIRKIIIRNLYSAIMPLGGYRGVIAVFCFQGPQQPTTGVQANVQRYSLTWSTGRSLPQVVFRGKAWLHRDPWSGHMSKQTSLSG